MFANNHGDVALTGHPWPRATGSHVYASVTRNQNGTLYFKVVNARL